MSGAAFKQVVRAVSHFWGERCPDYDAHCLTCRAWSELDRMEALSAASVSEVRNEIEARMTERGGYTRETLAAWGVPWPPPKGWKAALIAQGGVTRMGGDPERGSVAEGHSTRSALADAPNLHRPDREDKA